MTQWAVGTGHWAVGSHGGPVMQVCGHRDLKVFRLGYELAMRIYEVSKSYPKAETYSLTDQVRRSSRSVCANIAEAYRGRQYPQLFAKKLAVAGEVAETIVWLEFSRDCGYLSADDSEMVDRYNEVGRMLGAMILNPEKFAPRTGPGAV